MSYFVFALTNPEAELLLKQEVQTFYPKLKLSYSRPGFLTFKSETPVVFKPQLARLSGTCIGKVNPEEVKADKLWAWARTPELTLPSKFQKLSDNTLYKTGEKVSLLMMVGENEFWMGEYKLEATHFQTPGEVSSIPEIEVPSRAYYKMAEAFESYDLDFQENDIVLELGSAPGGASHFLLDQGMKVIGVDPAEMDQTILGHKNFRHIKKPFETLTETSFREEVDWIVSDINLPPTVVTKEIMRLLGFLNPQGLVITLKLNQDKHLSLINDIMDKVERKGFKRVELKYLPSHRKEIALIALRS